MPLVKRPLDLEVETLVTAAGFDKSESASENFLYLLYDAVEQVAIEIEASHEEGLCYDATHALADALSALLQESRQAIVRSGH